MKKVFSALDYVLEPASWGLAGVVAVLLFAGPSLIGAKEPGAAAKAAAAAKAQQAAKAAQEAPEAESGGFPSTDAEETPAAGEEAEEETPAAEEPAPAGADGAAVFASAGCGSCHTLAAAGSSGSTGPNLDDAAPDAATVEAVVRSGRGIMPAFEGDLSDEEITALAAFVSG